MKRLLKACVVVGILLLLTIAAQQGMFEHITDGNWVAGYVREQGLQALAVLFTAGALFTAVGGPRQVIAFVFGFALGGPSGALVSTLSTLLGCGISFYLARFTIRKPLQRRFGRRINRLEALLIEQTWVKVLMVRLLPVGSNLLTNLFAGATHVGATGFLLGSFIGYLPQMLIFSFAGAGIGLSDHYQLATSIGLFVVSSLIGAHLYRSRLRKQVEDIETLDKESV
ncbi:TVP38/TMEM64 family protein [Shewanella salipaludis]|uniref:TVP38/TMEM64 family membrane protein n=1 Tax=Shewanella salipaludis TaxID=2723052 RepID=A0A972G3T0_9GAMM|nr:VTT domain-containing protein [Shewanella salipaludis]NMH66689.1 VTT domain-containing protein [Shewanella salipaludis]